MRGCVCDECLKDLIILLNIRFLETQQRVVAKNGGINGRFLVRGKTRPRLVPLTGRPVENIFEENHWSKSHQIFQFFIIPYLRGSDTRFGAYYRNSIKLVVNYLHFCYLESGGLVSFYLLKL